MSDQPDEILTIEKAASFLNAFKRTVYRPVPSGENTGIQALWNVAIPPSATGSVDRQSDRASDRLCGQ
jgi:hypothetical protein